MVDWMALLDTTLGVPATVEAANSVRAGYIAGQTRWPGVRLTPETFMDAVARTVEAEDAPLTAMRRLVFDDLFLATACAAGLDSGLATFEREFVPLADRALRRAGSRDVDTDLQRFRIHVLVSVDSPPRIARYSGRGRLTSWVQVVAGRLAQTETAEQTEVDAVWLDAEGVDPELAFLRQAHREVFETSLRTAFEALPARARTLLRYRYVDRLEVSAIARLLGLHRGSASRLLTQARSDLRSNLRQELVATVGLSPSEADSLTRLLKSHLNVSITRLLD